MAFDTPMIVADLVPGEATRCFSCGSDSSPRPRTELWAVKHRHPKHHDGFVRFYCAAHRPEPPSHVPRPQVTVDRAPAPRRRVTVEKERAVCPDCFVEVPATGVCGMCGQKVA